MKAIKRKLFITLLFVFIFISGFAQQTILTSGGNAVGTEGSVSYSVGQTAYTSQKGTSGNVYEGVQQPYEISVVNKIEELGNITLQCKAFPNPVSNNLNLKLENIELKNLTYQLYNIEGKLLESKEIETTDLTISMEKYTKATYFLKIMHLKKPLSTFKIIKN